MFFRRFLSYNVSIDFINAILENYRPPMIILLQPVYTAIYVIIVNVELYAGPVECTEMPDGGGGGGCHE